MNSFRRISSTIAAIAILGSAHVGAVQAQTTEEINVEDCACVVPGGNTGQAIGSINSVTGTVLISAPAGFSPAAVGAALSSGSRIIVGPQSTTEIQIGQNCRLQIDENRDVSLVALNGDLCVWVKDATGQSTAGNTGTGGTGGAGAGAAIAAVAAFGVPLAILAISP